VIRAACRALQTLPVTLAPYEPVGRPRGGQTNHVLAKPPRPAGDSPKDPQPAPVAVRYGQPSFEFRIRPTRGVVGTALSCTPANRGNSRAHDGSTQLPPSLVVQLTPPGPSYSPTLEGHSRSSF
jgi:hypothetical protein